MMIHLFIEFYYYHDLRHPYCLACHCKLLLLLAPLVVVIDVVSSFPIAIVHRSFLQEMDVLALCAVPFWPHQHKANEQT